MASTQINEHSDLCIRYRLLKKGHSYQSIHFFVNQQLLIPFELSVDNAKVQTAWQHLATLDIAEPKLVQGILQTPRHLDALFAFIYKITMEKIKATKNLERLFLEM